MQSSCGGEPTLGRGAWDPPPGVEVELKTPPWGRCGVGVRGLTIDLRPVVLPNGTGVCPSGRHHRMRLLLVVFLPRTQQCREKVSYSIYI